MRTVLQAARQTALEAVFDAVAVGIAVAARGDIVEVNGTFLELLELTREQVVGTSARELLRSTVDVAGDVEFRGRWLRVAISSLDGPRGSQRFTVYAVCDVTELRTQALYDAVTGLPNRHLLQDRLQQALTYGRRTATQTAVLFVDVDDFKTVNDRAGHAAGDEVLAQVAHRIVSAARKSDTVGRWAGDEFVVVSQDVRTLGDAALVATRIREACAQPFIVNGEVFHLGASVGLASTRTATNAEALLDAADRNMYAQKRTRPAAQPAPLSER